jgi:hypothetical protein
MTHLASAQAPRRDSSSAAWRYGREEIGAALDRAGLRYRTWEFRYRLTQAAYARWLSIPVMTDVLFADVDAEERDRRIERALSAVDARSFKWERWRGWTAWTS